MTQATDTDIREIKDLIAAGNAATQKQIADLALSTQKQIADLREEMRLGFTKLDGKIDNLDGRLVAVESSNKTIDGRLWGLIATLLGLTVTALLGIFVRYLFSHDSII
jgi:uncharacterized tellurite resistance protein B-like protein